MPEIASRFFSAADGLKLHALEAGPNDAARLPTVCLPGLARTSEDFRVLIEALAFDRERPRRVIALDSRGRGRSDYDRNPDNYSVPVELGDVMRLLDEFGIARAIFIGTSRGGILSMSLALARRPAIAGVVLNDIGPLLEMRGLIRIKGYVGKMAPPKDYHDAVRILRGAMGDQFPAWDGATWERYARLTWKEENDRLVTRYDSALSNALADVDPYKPAPAMWPQFDALAGAPIMVIRGEHSDLLSRETVSDMKFRRPDLIAIEIAGQGHAPLLTGAETIGPIREFAARCDGPQA
jgi:pimeloyl-ACP methyl ester carboxylesterase